MLKLASTEYGSRKCRFSCTVHKFLVHSWLFGLCSTSTTLAAILLALSSTTSGSLLDLVLKFRVPYPNSTVLEEVFVSEDLWSEIIRHHTSRLFSELLSTVTWHTQRFYTQGDSIPTCEVAHSSRTPCSIQISRKKHHITR
jgi:hypothetical protein